MANDNKQFLAEELERIRTKLLDMSGRNRLLNFRGQSSCVTIVDELPQQVYGRLINEEKDMSFKPIPEDWLDQLDKDEKNYTKQELLIESANKAHIDISSTLPEEYGDTSQRKRKHLDCYLQTNLFMKELETKLRRIKSNARTIIEETGQNQLFLVMGFLKWADIEKGEDFYEAPLILIPVEIFKGKLYPNTKKYTYGIKYTGEDLIPNVSLAEKLKRDFDIILPDFDDDKLKFDTEDYNSLDPEKYFDAVSSATSNMRGWKVARKMVMGFFSFSKLLMYKDLDPKNPVNASLMDNRIVQRLLLGTKGDSTSSISNYKEENPIENQILNLPLVVDADSSQSKSILKVLSGNNIVIQGPPGTGKSQTITNLIACMINQEKSVLFVAEKMAALEVVKVNLEKVGLGEFCLELHSHKSKKKEILTGPNGLQKRLNKRFSRPEESQSLRNRLLEHQDTLGDYINLLHKEISPISKSIFEIFWKADNLRCDYPEIHHLIENCSQISAKQVEDSVALLNELEEHRDFVHSSNNIWDGYVSTELYYGDETLLKDKFVESCSCIDDILTILYNSAAKSKICLYEQKISLSFLEKLYRILDYQFDDDFNHELLVKLVKSEGRDIKDIREFISKFKAYKCLDAELKHKVYVENLQNYTGQYNVVIFNSINHITLANAQAILTFIKQCLGTINELRSLLNTIEENNLTEIHELEQLSKFLKLASTFKRLNINPDDPKHQNIFSCALVKIAQKAFNTNESLKNRKQTLEKTFSINDSPASDEIQNIRKILRQNIPLPIVKTEN